MVYLLYELGGATDQEELLKHRKSQRHEAWKQLDKMKNAFEMIRVTNKWEKLIDTDKRQHNEKSDNSACNQNLVSPQPPSSSIIKSPVSLCL